MATENTDSSREATASSDSPTALPMTIYTDSSFFKEHPGATLPSPAEVRAINIATGDPCADEFDSPPPVVIRDLDRFIKYGRFVTIVEASTQIMVREKLQGKVPVPEVFGWVDDGGQGFIYMSLVEGDTLEERWSEMAEDERLDVWKHLKQPLNDIILRDFPENLGPFEGPDAIEKFLITCGIEINDKKDIVFTNADLLLSNISC